MRPPEPTDPPSADEETTFHPDGGETILRHSRKPDSRSEDEKASPEGPGEIPPKTEEASGRSVFTLLGTRLDPGAGVRLGEADADPVVEGSASARRNVSLGEIARGGMGAILKLVDRDIRRPVAMKVMIGEESGGRIERFVEEAQVTGQLEHPNIVPVHELGLDPEGRVYFTMKLVKGESLEEVIDRLDDPNEDVPAPVGPSPRASLGDLLLVFLKTCDAVSFAHARGVIHRDLKPENVMLGDFGEVLVVDWGLAKVQGVADRAREDLVATARSERETGRSITGDVMGTPSYMPPEQADGRVEEIDQRSDVFSLGGILYTILTREAPYAGETVTNVMVKAVEGRIVPPRKRAPSLPIPPELESICLKAMSPDKDDRYPDVPALAEDVRAFLDRRLVSAHRYSPFARFARFVQRHPGASLASAVSFLLLLAGGAAAWILAERAAAASARADAARADARVQTLQREQAEREADLARRDADEARSALDKGQAVADVLLSAEVDFEPFLLELKRRRHGGFSLQERLAHLEANEKNLEAFEKSIRPDDASAAAWLALKGWFLHLGGKTQDARACFLASRDKDPEVPYAALFEAMTHLGAYLEAIRFPRPYFDETMTPKYRKDIPRTEAMVDALRRFEAALKVLHGEKTWGERNATEFTALLDGFRGLHEGHLRRAEIGFSEALRVTELRWIREELFRARMTVRYLQWNRWGKALEDADRLLFDMPDHARVHEVAGLILITVGGGLHYQDRTPAATYAKAVEHFEKALAVDPDRTVLTTYIAIAHRQMGIYAYHNDGDPLPYYDRSLEIAATGLEGLSPPDEKYARINRALTFQMRAKQRAVKGENALDDYHAALADLDVVARIDPDDFTARFSRGDLLRRLAGARRTPPGEVEDLYRKALKDLAQASSLGGFDPALIYILGRTHLNLGDFLYGRGEIPSVVYGRALEVSESALKKAPQDMKNSLNRIRALHALTLCALRAKDGKALSWSEKAQQAARDLAVAMPDCWEAHQERGKVLGIRGNLASIEGDDPEPYFREAVESFGKAIDINPKDVTSLFSRGQIKKVLGDIARQKKKDPRDFYRDAASDFQRAVERLPWQSVLHRERAKALQALAEARLQAGEDPRDTLDEAASACETWASARPGEAQAILRRGLILARWSEIEAFHEGDDASLAEQAVDEIGRALKAGAGSVEARLARADRLAWLGRFEEALADLEQALPRARERRAAVETKREELKAQLAAPAWARSLWRGQDAYRRGAWNRADAFFRKGFQAAREADAAADPDRAEALVSPLFSHACVQCQLSRGRHAQGGHAPIPKKRRDALLAQALASLDEAVRLGLEDLDPIEKNPWLAPVRKMPEYAGHMAAWKERVRKKGDGSDDE